MKRQRTGANSSGGAAQRVLLTIRQGGDTSPLRSTEDRFTMVWQRTGAISRSGAAIGDTTVEDVFEVMPVNTVEAEVQFAMCGDWRKVEACAAAVLRCSIEAYAAEVLQL